MSSVHSYKQWQWVRCYCVIVNGVALWCVMWPCGGNQWRHSQLAATPASQQSRRSLNQDHACDLEVWRHSATTPRHQNSSYTPATQLKHQFSNAFCWESLKTTVSNLQPPLPAISIPPYLHPSECVILFKNVPHSRPLSTPVIPVSTPTVPSAAKPCW